MARSWTFGEKIGAGFGAVVLLSLLSSVLAVWALRTVSESQEQVLAVYGENLIDAERVRASVERQGGAARGFLLTRDETFLDQMKAAQADLGTLFTRLRTATTTDEGKRLVEELERADPAYRTSMERVLALRRTDATLEVVCRAFDVEVLPKREQLDQGISAFVGLEQRHLSAGRKEAAATSSAAMAAVSAISLASLLLAVAIALGLTRTLTQQVGSAVQHIQSASVELQSAANQQVSNGKEQATAMSEITTTMSELRATSRQIAESAQRVAHIAEETGNGARSGEQTVAKGTESNEGIKRQVDLIVTHMLDLGRKSQQIGAILEITKELAEQTNILAINATIEAAGAGDAGKRFAVVADEIRKLADRVGGSTKQIRALIDEIRSAVNVTVMTTEGGTKAVEAGARQFTDVAAAFRQIVTLVSTTTEAAKEIELSTRQQSTAVEQVSLAVTDIAQATRETEASLSQTFQTASELASLSQELLRLVQPRSNG